MAGKKTVDKTLTTKAPSGLSITREGNIFVFTWKIDDDDYDKGQQLQYKINSADWTKVTIDKDTTSKSCTITMANYFPTTSKKIKAITFRVRGRRKSHTKESTKEIINYSYNWSDWAAKKYVVELPSTPELTAELSDEYANVTNFSWETEGTDDDDTTWFTDVVYQTILVPNCNSNGSQQTWARTNSGWATAGGLSATGDVTKTEDLTTSSITRFFRVKARGPRGETEWVYAKHVYAAPQAPEITSAKVKKVTGGYQCTLKWKAPSTKAHPADQIVIQQAVATPVAGMAPPSGTVWTDVLPIKNVAGKTSASFVFASEIGTDQVGFVRVMSEHDPYDTSRAYSQAVIDSALIGPLATPSDLSVTLVSGHVYRVTATNNTAVPGSRLVVTSVPKGESKLTRRGYINAGSSSVDVTIKASAFSVVVFAEVPGYHQAARSEMISWDSSSMEIPARPTGLSVSLAKESSAFARAENTPDTVLATWTNNWDSAEGTELSWSRDRNAWESTEEPATYTINSDAERWYIPGLELGIWYFRVRSFNSDGLFSQYSNTAALNLAQEPFKPMLSLSAGKVRRDGNVTVSWNYTNPDGSEQAYAEIRNVTYSGSTPSYGSVIATAETAKSVILYPRDIGWGVGEHHISARVVSSMGRHSDWAPVATITVASKPTATISATSLQNATITQGSVSRTVLSLKTMPMTVTVTGADAGGITTVSLVRRGDYHMERPNEDEFDGFDGEAVAIVRQEGDAQITITNDDLIGRLDDGAKYTLIAEVTDELGQTARARKKFEVHWTHQARRPTATVVVDGLITKITPIKPANAQNTDVCDIYRLSVDKPELIVEGAAWGTTYVDPYPTLGQYGGHRIVLRTANGDYITSTNRPAWRDYGEGEDDIIDLHYPATIIDFDGNQAILRWNMDVSSAWEKDFIETKYLGGAVQGDWNAAVSRTTNVSVTVLPDEEPVLITKMRRLADYPGICHVRTPDGSSFAADVQVKETSGAKMVTFDLSITRVHPEGFDGMTLAQWEEEAED